MLKHARLAVLSGIVALVGCAAPDDAYPSLAIRESERVSGEIAAPVAAPYQTAAPGPAEADAELLFATAKVTHVDFLNAVPEVRNAVAAARGAPRNSEAWTRAQIAIADLETSRAQLMIALADLDRLTVDAAVAGQQFSTLAAKRDEVAALADSETQLITAMLESLAQ